MYRRQDETENAPALAERLAVLEAENRKLQTVLQALTEQAARNDALMRKTRDRELELLGAESLAQLFERLIDGLKASHQLDLVSLVIHDPQHEVRRMLADEGVAPDARRELHFVDVLPATTPSLAALYQPWLGPFRAAEHGALVPRHSGLGSLAIIPLRHGDRMSGVLVFGSADRRRFVASLASDFLAHLGIVAAISLENAVNRMHLTRSGFTDFLTGFHNRRYLNARLREELARAQRSGEPVACLMIDVDHFKRINDRHGHPGGDAVLREVARRIDGQMRTSDTGARFGGDEFAIVLPDGRPESAERVASRVLHAVRGDPVAIESGAQEIITLSIGVAVAMPQGATRDYAALAARLIAEADAALYRAKSAGRNRIESSQGPVV